MMKRLFLLSIAAIGLFACQQVSDLSDDAEVFDIVVSPLSPDDVKLGKVSVEKDIISVEILSPDYPFPLKLKVENIETSPTTDNILGLPDTLFFANECTSGHEFHLIAESGVPHKYEVRVKTQNVCPDDIPNADFELWTNVDDEKKINIDPTPGKGRGWATANNFYVQGAKPLSYDGGYAVQLTTARQDIDLLKIHLIAAGSLYTGFFTLSTNFANPRLMTNFGIPHRLRVAAVEFEAQYLPGPQLMQASNEGSGYHVDNIEGVDDGQAWVELLNWSGKSDLIYHGLPIDGLKVLGRAEYVFNGSTNDHQDWRPITLPIEYYPEYEDITPTHIVVVFSSSKEGDLFKGAPGSILNVDNVELIY
ncbi:hypothetical protein AGMMS49965_01600 [Bacteroidia bacterium]|nr:hypothetical protein AGMMS49965_01600 [Bacteroidia bacterium]